MSGERFASVWDAIEGTPAAAEVMRVRAGLMVALQGHVARSGLTRAEAARRLGVTRARLEELVRGKVDRFSVEALVGMAVRAGLGGLGGGEAVMNSASRPDQPPMAALPAYEAGDSRLT